MRARIQTEHVRTYAVVVPAEQQYHGRRPTRLACVVSCAMAPCDPTVVLSIYVIDQLMQTCLVVVDLALYTSRCAFSLHYEYDSTRGQRFRHRNKMGFGWGNLSCGLSCCPHVKSCPNSRPHGVTWKESVAVTANQRSHLLLASRDYCDRSNQIVVAAYLILLGSHGFDASNQFHAAGVAYRLNFDREKERGKERFHRKVVWSLWVDTRMEWKSVQKKAAYA